MELAKSRNFKDMDAGVQIRNWNSVMKIASHYDKPKWRENVQVEVHWGVTGAGKSHNVYEPLRVGNIEFYEKSSTTKWWDGYDGEDVVVMDEFRGLINVGHCLKWWDKFPCNVEIKGGQVPLKATKFYIMSNLDPAEWFADIDPATKEAIMRRLTKVTKYTMKYGETDNLDNIFDL